jgi:hypothetical protein
VFAPPGGFPPVARVPGGRLDWQAMRCPDLAGTWTALLSWFDEQEVLVLPRLTGIGPTVRLDADLSADRPATAAEVAVAADRLRRVVDCFGLPAVYVGQVHAGPAQELASVTVRAVAGGIVHELTLVAAWYVVESVDIDRSLSPAVT